jgi:phosphoglycolate phosphatase
MVHLVLRGQPLMSAGHPADIKVVLFDKDGTMSRSEPHLLALATTRLRHCLRLGGATRKQELAALLEKAYGLDAGAISLDPAGIIAVAARDHNLISTAVALTLVGHGWPESLALAEETFRLADLEPPSGPPHAPTTDGLVELLMALRQRGVRCAVISNDDLPGIQGFLAAHGLADHIAAIWSAERLPRKPDPQAVHQLCAALEVHPSSCALIGDANSDLRMGRAAGVAVVMGYRGGWRRPVALEPTYPWLDHWRELVVAEVVEPAHGVSTETRGMGFGT